MSLDLCRWVGHFGGRPFEVGQRSGCAAGRSRIALSAGILPPVSEPVGLAAGSIRRQRLSQSAADARLRKRWQAGGGGCEPGRASGVRAGLARAGGTGSLVPAGYEFRAELPHRRSRHHRPALRWRSRDAHSPGNRARDRRLSRIESFRAGANRVSHERGPLGISRPGARAEPDGKVCDEFCRGARACSRKPGVHDAHSS